MKRKWIRCLLLAAAFFVACVAVGLAFITWQAGRRSTVEQWVGGQVQLIADAYLRPKLRFDDLLYQFPGTVRLKHFRLTADDPGREGQTIDVLAADEATIVLAEVPHVGQPIKIESISLNKPLFQAVATPPQANGEHGFIGLTDIMRTPAEAATQPAATATAMPKLSSMFQIRAFELIDGHIVFDPRVADQPPLDLDHINTRMDIHPDRAGWYKLQTHVERAPVFDLQLATLLSLDDFITDDMAIQLQANLGQEKQSFLPPVLQKLLRSHAVRGSLKINLAGGVPILDYKKGKLHAEASLAGGNVSLGQYKVPVDRLAMIIELADGKVWLRSLSLEALRGKATMTGDVTLDASLDTNLKLSVDGMQLEDLLEEEGSTTPDDQKMAGRVEVELEAAAPLTAVLANAVATTQPSTAQLPQHWGGGRAVVDHARLVQVPAIQSFTHAVNAGWSMFGHKQPSTQPTEKAAVAFDLSNDAIRCSEITYEGQLVAARGNGSVFLDQRLDLKLNGGPLEKMQANMGDSGTSFAQFTDSLATYHVVGTIDDPHVLVVPGKRVEQARKAGSEVKDAAADGAHHVADGVRGAASKIRGMFGNHDD